MKRRFKYYEILEINKNATNDQIKAAYRKLVKIYHPDVNKEQDATEKIKLINKAYQVLSNEKTKAEYDNSPAECPLCYTHEVIQSSEMSYRCRACWCKFDISNPDEIIETIEKAAISEKRRDILKAFQTTQCSWCRKFYTNEPFLCPDRKLKSNCFSFQRLSQSERRTFLEDERWWLRMADMLQSVQEKGILAKCRYCFSLNPNPQKSECWRCGKDGLRCPGCNAEPFLRYSMETDRWKCPNTAHGKTYAYVTKSKETKYVASDEICPNCGKKLDYDTELWLWRCRSKDGCKRIFTHDDLHNNNKSQKDYKEDNFAKNRESQTRYTEKDSTKDILRSRKNTHWIIVLVVFLAVVLFGIMGWIILKSSCSFTVSDSEESSSPAETGSITDEIENNFTPILMEEGFSVFENIQPPYYGAFIDSPVKLINNPSAKNPTWHDLKDFLQEDTTDRNSYIPGIRVCADFAADIHNRAEEAGIRAAWVSLDFVDDPIGHALNAFNTTDQGLLFVDCTGAVPEIQIPQIDTETGEIVEPVTCFESHDKRAYIKIGEECGFIGIDVIAGFDYESFTKYQYKWKLLEERIDKYVAVLTVYNDRVNQFNDEVSEYEELVAGRTVIEDIDEYNKLHRMFEELSVVERELKQESSELSLESYHIDSELENLGRCRREPLGVVKAVEIYW